MAMGTLAAFWLVSLMFVLTPGADWAFAMAAGIRGRVMPAVGGMLTGHLMATLVVAAGIASVVAGSARLMTVLTVGGACYLAWLGVETLRRPPTPQLAVSEPHQSWITQAAKGFGVSALNPKVLLLFVALLPQFTSVQASWPVAAQIMALGAVHVVSCAVVYTGVGGGAQRVLCTRPTVARQVSRFSGVVMVVVAVVLVAEQAV